MERVSCHAPRIVGVLGSCHLLFILVAVLSPFLGCSRAVTEGILPIAPLLLRVALAADEPELGARVETGTVRSAAVHHHWAPHRSDAAAADVAELCSPRATRRRHHLPVIVVCIVRGGVRRVHVAQHPEQRRVTRVHYKDEYVETREISHRLDHAGSEGSDSVCERVAQI